MGIIFFSTTKNSHKYPKMLNIIIENEDRLTYFYMI